ncbi:unnamed protein product [Aphanomyces euteiches]
MIYTLSSVSLDEEIQDLLTTVFYNEFCYDMESPDHEKNVLVPATASKRRCKVDQCANAVVSKGRVAVDARLKDAKPARNEKDFAGNTVVRGNVNVKDAKT